jgi:hypothetical protein
MLKTFMKQRGHRAFGAMRWRAVHERAVFGSSNMIPYQFGERDHILHLELLSSWGVCPLTPADYLGTKGQSMFGGT